MLFYSSLTKIKRLDNLSLTFVFIHTFPFVSCLLLFLFVVFWVGYTLDNIHSICRQVCAPCTDIASPPRGHTVSHHFCHFLILLGRSIFHGSCCNEFANFGVRYSLGRHTSLCHKLSKPSTDRSFLEAIAIVFHEDLVFIWIGKMRPDLLHIDGHVALELLVHTQHCRSILGPFVFRY